MISAIHNYLTHLGVTLPQADRDVIGGYFVYLTLPKPLQAEDVAMSAKEDENLIIAPGPVFGVYGDEKAVDLTRKVRLSFSWEAEDKLAEGVQRLGQVIVRLQKYKALEESPLRRPSGDSRLMMEQYR